MGEAAGVADFGDVAHCVERRVLVGIVVVKTTAWYQSDGLFGFS